MYRGCTIAAVVPAYNEEAHLGAVLETLPDFVDRVYVVDDGSEDDTWAVLETYATVRVDVPAAADSSTGTTWPAALVDDRPRDDGMERVVDGGTGRRIVGIRHLENRGVGGAIKTGYRFALHDDVDVTVVVSGDGQMHPTYLDRIVDPVIDGRADYAKGTRFARPEHVASMSRWRRFGNRLLTYLTRVATGYWAIADPQNGYTAISAGMLARIDLDRLYDRYGFLNDLLAELSRRSARVVDVPHPAIYGDERSGIRYTTFVPKLSWLLLTNFLGRLWRTAVRNPFDPAAVGYLLGGTGVAVSGISAAAILLGATVSVPMTPVWTVPAALVLGGMCIVVGLAVEARDGGRAETTDGSAERRREA